jgi:ABC-2 type transport system permease protein
MKSRTSFFDRTVLKKDITRFAPLWALYLIGGLMIAISSGISGDELNEWLGGLGVVSICYAILVAQLLFGDLFNTRLCNALHAMPLRREGWFFTHVVSGILFSLVPNLLIALALTAHMISSNGMWYLAFIWLLGMELHYLFFFGLAVLCMMVTGNRFAAVAVYLILNFLSMIVMWFCTTIFQPMLYGVVIRTEIFAPFSPVVGLFQEQDYFTLIHGEECWCHFTHDYYVHYPHTYYWGGWGESWGYLIVLAVLGVVFGAVALVLYRKRNLESAGDFMAFKSMKPVFTVAYTLCVGALLEMMGDGMGVPFYIFLMIGLIVGYFTSQMLLSRSLRVFKWKNWLALVLIFALVFGGIGLCRIDAFGMVSWTPDVEDVVSVKVANSRVTEFTSYNTDAEVKDPAEIEKLIAIHKLLYAEGPTADRPGNGWQNITLCYTLKDGREIYRQYRAAQGGQAQKEINSMIFANPRHILRADSLEELISLVKSAKIEGMEIQKKDLASLLTALWNDGMDGDLLVDPGKYGYVGYVEMQYTSGIRVNLEIWDSYKHTSRWITDTLMHCTDAGTMLQYVDWIEINGRTLDWGQPTEMEEFCTLFAQDNENGTIRLGAAPDGYIVTVYMKSGVSKSFTVQEKSLKTYQWIEKFAGISAP